MAGEALKEIRSTHWNTLISGATNNSGCIELPARSYKTIQLLFLLTIKANGAPLKFIMIYKVAGGDTSHGAKVRS